MCVRANLNFISVAIHCQLFPFTQVCLSSVELEADGVEIFSRSLLPAELRPPPLPLETAAASKQLAAERRIPLSVTHPD